MWKTTFKLDRPEGRKPVEIKIGDDVTIRVALEGHYASVAIDAPRTVPILKDPEPK